MDYDFRTLDLDDESDEAATLRKGWMQAVRSAFRETRPDEDVMKRWLTTARSDGYVARGAWLPASAYGDSTVPVATFVWFDKTLNVGREVIPARLVTDVTTSPAHRRRGLLRRLMEDGLETAAAESLPVALLTATEATIYGRWGFGIATTTRKVNLDTRTPIALRHDVDRGRVELIDPRTSWDTIRNTFELFHAVTRGSVSWPAFYEEFMTGSFDFENGGEDKALAGAVHLDPHEQVDGFVLYKPETKDDSPGIRVVEMVALNPAAQLGLWTFLAGIDLARFVRFWAAHPADPLQWALTDFNRLTTTGVEEFLWLRVLDVPRTLQARPWVADGQVVIEVDDPQGHTSGRWLITTHDGIAEVVAADDKPAQVHLGVETLASLVLGTAAVKALEATGRITGDDAAVDRLAAMADLALPPYNLTFF